MTIIPSHAEIEAARMDGQSRAMHDACSECCGGAADCDCGCGSCETRAADDEDTIALVVTRGQLRRATQALDEIAERIFIAAAMHYQQRDEAGGREWQAILDSCNAIRSALSCARPEPVRTHDELCGRM